MIKYIVTIYVSLFLNSTYINAHEDHSQVKTGNEEELCRVSNIKESSEKEVDFCIEAMGAVEHKDFKKYTYESLSKGFGSPALEIYGNKLFKDSKEQKKKNLYNAAYQCYEPAYFPVFKLELASNNLDAFLWAMLIEQNTQSDDKIITNRGVSEPLKSYLKENKIDSIRVDHIIKFFERLNCRKDNKRDRIIRVIR